MHEIKWRLQCLGDTNCTVGRLSFHLRGARLRVSFRTRDAHIHQLPLQLPNKFAILGVYGWNSTKFPRPHKAIHENLIIGHDRALVRHEVLEAINPMVVHQGAHICVDRIVPPSHCNMESIIRNSLFRPLPPLQKCFHQGLLWTRDHKINDAGCAPCQASCGTGKKIFTCNCAHKRQLHVRMRINTTRHHVLAVGLHDLSPGRYLQVRPNFHDLTIDTRYICANALVRIYHSAASNQDRHWLPPIFNRIYKFSSAITPKP